MSTPKAPTRVRFDVPEEYPRLARAASLALAVVRHTKHKTWGDLVVAITAEDPATLALLAQVEITAADSDLLADPDVDLVLRMLRTAPLLSVAVCPACGGWILIQGGTVPTRCKVTLRCDGGGSKPIKASIATKAKDDEPPDEPDVPLVDVGEEPEPGLTVQVDVTVRTAEATLATTQTLLDVVPESDLEDFD